jgi:hypothetical protein
MLQVLFASFRLYLSIGTPRLSPCPLLWQWPCFGIRAVKVSSGRCRLFCGVAGRDLALCKRRVGRSVSLSRAARRDGSPYQVRWPTEVEVDFVSQKGG